MVSRAAQLRYLLSWRQRSGHYIRLVFFPAASRRGLSCFHPALSTLGAPVVQQSKWRQYVCPMGA